MIRVAVRAGVARIALDRAAKRNAMTPEMLRGLAEALASLSPDQGARCILLEADGDVFCAGFDLKLCQADPGALKDLLRGLSDAIAALRGSPLPVVACVTGAAVAGGCALLAGADIVVADAACKLGYPVLRLGISPAVSAPTLRTRIGDGPTRARLLDTRLIDAAEALRIGLVHHVLPTPAEARAAAEQIAADLATKPAAGIAATKAWLNELDGVAAAEIAAALEVSLSLVGGEEERERLAAAWGRG